MIEAGPKSGFSEESGFFEGQRVIVRDARAEFEGVYLGADEAGRARIFRLDEPALYLGSFAYLAPAHGISCCGHEDGSGFVIGQYVLAEGEGGTYLGRNWLGRLRVRRDGKGRSVSCRAEAVAPFIPSVPTVE